MRARTPNIFPRTAPGRFHSALTAPLCSASVEMRSVEMKWDERYERSFTDLHFSHFSFLTSSIIPLFHFSSRPAAHPLFNRFFPCYRLLQCFRRLSVLGGFRHPAHSDFLLLKLPFVDFMLRLRRKTWPAVCPAGLRTRKASRISSLHFLRR